MENITAVSSRTNRANETTAVKSVNNEFIKLMIIIVGLHIGVISALYYIGMSIVMN